MRTTLLVVLIVLAWAHACPAEVKTGLDVLRDRQFDLLQGKRVGVVTNHTGIDAKGKHLVDLLLEANVNIVKLFSPEHGLYGIKDDKVADMVDEKTGLPVLSLYGATRRPTPEMLAGVDVLVFDIQDIGTRFYTYISTMGYCMEEAAKAGVSFVVLDRPNPITGLRVEGPIAQEKHLGFTAYRPIPLVHGMTVGELARLFNAEFDINVDLTVVEMQGWRRDMLRDDTGIAWVNPSPNMRSPLQALLYPAIGMLESSNIAVGRGTPTPFELFGAPYIDGQALAARLNAFKLPGLLFEPVTFTPRNTHHKFNDTVCHGVRVIATDRSAIDSVHAGAVFAWTLHQMYPDDWQSELFVRMVQNDDAVKGILSAADPMSVNDVWRAELDAWKATRAKYLIYPN
jgi:uncharacterized protein YbbC (DUF1343 family)